MPTLCHIDDIAENQSKGFEIDDTSLFAVKKDNLIYVYKNSCPHLGIEMNWQEDDFLDSDDALIQCSTHGALFLIESGACVSGPCVNEKLTAIEHHIDEQGFIQAKL